MESKANNEYFGGPQYSRYQNRHGKLTLRYTSDPDFAPIYMSRLTKDNKQVYAKLITYNRGIIYKGYIFDFNIFQSSSLLEFPDGTFMQEKLSDNGIYELRPIELKKCATQMILISLIFYTKSYKNPNVALSRLDDNELVYIVAPEFINLKDANIRVGTLNIGYVSERGPFIVFNIETGEEWPAECIQPATENIPECVASAAENASSDKSIIYHSVDGTKWYYTYEGELIEYTTSGKRTKAAIREAEQELNEI